ncbi:hypothetical protein AB6A40_001063 [Gnathostoma spinigerum]|uniref:protein-tyrosine-phosphatase n=1 Tax=Gnathostoma spinigerum TaxID=75299 RepID=A0ABD6E3B9_9BILA
MKDILERFIQCESNLAEKDYTFQFYKIRREQDDLRLADGYSCSTGMKASYHQKNRYRDIIPYDKNRVRLRSTDCDELKKENDENGDYINASFIQVPPADAVYIAAQAPLSSTLNDWFQLIRENNIDVVVMLCNLVELGKQKCERYWPDVEGKEELFGQTRVTLLKEHIFTEYCRRDLRLQYSDGVERNLIQLHYSEWPDHGCPQTETHVLEMISLFDKLHYEQPRNPVLIHCSAGCGRTGTIIAANVVRELINSKNLTSDLDLCQLVIELRKQRASMVQTPDQYRFLHKLVVHFCSDVLRDMNGECENSTNHLEGTSSIKSAAENDNSSSSNVPPTEDATVAGETSKEDSIDSPHSFDSSAIPVIPVYPDEPLHLKPYESEIPPWDERNTVAS